MEVPRRLKVCPTGLGAVGVGELRRPGSQGFEAMGLESTLLWEMLGGTEVPCRPTLPLTAAW